MRTLVHSAEVYGAGGGVDWVLFDDGRVAEVGSGAGWRGLEVDEVVDAEDVAGTGARLVPGFIDLHTHGGGGHEHESGAAAILAARAAHRAHGTTSAVISLVSASVDDLVGRVAGIADLTGTDGILGSHLEGPFLAPARKGAHDPAALIAPEAAAVTRLLEAGDGTVRQVTLAPELSGGLEAVRAVAAGGGVAAVGHTEADRSVAASAFDAGARLVTHAFNAMPPLLHREPGPLGAALSDARVAIELIVDGVHVHDDLVRLVFAAAPDRTVMVTDAMAAAGAGDGAFKLGGLDVTVSDGVARLSDGAIAGSTLTQDAALRRAVSAGVPFKTALAAVTSTPARVLGRADLGILSPGAAADAVLLDADLQVSRVWAAGEAC